MTCAASYDDYLAEAKTHLQNAVMCLEDHAALHGDEEPWWEVRGTLLLAHLAMETMLRDFDEAQNVRREVEEENRHEATPAPLLRLVSTS